MAEGKITIRTVLLYMQAMESRLNARFEQVDRRFEYIDEKFNRRFEQLEERFDRRFNHVDMQIGNIDKRLDEIEIEELPKRVRKLERAVLR